MFLDIILKMNQLLNFKSKIDGCSLKRIGDMPINVSLNLKCIGVPGSSKSTEKIVLVDQHNYDDDYEIAYM